MGRTVAKTLQASTDLVVLALAYGLGFLIRFDWQLPNVMVARLLTTLPVIVVLQYVSLATFGIPRFAWSYVGLRETTRIFGSLAVASGLLVILRLLVGASSHGDPFQQPTFIPLGVVAIDFVLAFLGVVGVRVARRLMVEKRRQDQRRAAKPAGATRMLVVGAGQAGLLVAREVASRPDLGIHLVGYVDDDPLKRGAAVHGVTVLGSTSELAEVCVRTGATQVLLAIPQAPGTVVRRILDDCERVKVHAKVMPGLYEVVGGRVNLSRMRDVAIEDLLRRAPVSLDEGLIGETLRGRTVLVSGAGGSIGSELCRQVLRFSPSKLVLLDRSENSLFHIHRELVGLAGDSELVAALADVCDRGRIDSLLRAHRPSLLLHAAAHKHVPLMEMNPCEAIKNNVLGTRTLAQAAADSGVETFVMISTDKAVNPTSVMGATKRIAECFVQALSSNSQTRFAAVRFGNVLGSAGSVVPIFRQQIERGGPVTVTHPEMRRYFMTIPEASQLVLQAASMGQGGEIFILDMGEPVRVVDLAQDLIRLSGYKQDEIEVVFSGIRPGEKLFEELSLDEEKAARTRHPKIFIGSLRPLSLASIQAGVDRLERVALAGDEHAARDELKLLVPEYQASGSIAPRPPSESPDGVAAPMTATFGPAEGP
jgi:FlaA1/EpsC-like NDP-sugar epimerase